MSWMEDGGFHISRDKQADSPGGGIGFTASIYIGDGRTVRLALTKTDVQGIRRKAGRALKEQEKEGKDSGQ